jgi:RNA polymerase sigma factor (TIGR02999 family)
MFDQVESDDPSNAELLLPLVYDELRKLAANRLALESPGQTLQPTALVHEAYLRLAQGATRQSWESKGHFFAAAARAMRRILIDNARKKKSTKRGGRRTTLSMDEMPSATGSHSGVDILALDEALTKLHSIEPRKASLVSLRYFAGLTQQEAAMVLGISTSTADSDWAFAKAWLKVELARE